MKILQLELDKDCNDVDVVINHPQYGEYIQVSMSVQSEFFSYEDMEEVIDELNKIIFAQMESEENE